MRVVVCVKHVPDIHGERSFGTDARVTRGADDVPNELDENAVEAALELVEAFGGEVVALTVGPASAIDAVRRALQLGATTGVHVCDDRVAGADAIGTAAVLAAAVRFLAGVQPVDLVVTGMAALDGLTSVVPGALAALLGMPALTLASEVVVDRGVVRVRRDVGEVTEVLEAGLPAVVSVTDQAFAARFPTPQSIVAARVRPIEVLSIDDLGLGGHETGGAGARTRVDDAHARPAKPASEVVVDTGNAGRRLVAFLASQSLV